MKFVFDNKIQRFIDYCNDNEVELYLVGGSVRDYLVNKKTYDLDFALASDYLKALDIIKREYKCNSDDRYRAIKLVIDDYNIEISHCRNESEYLDYRHPNVIEFCSDIKKDSKRRDFTINALYYKDGNIYDFYNGLEDLKNRKLRVIGDTLTRFKEDPIRILRMIRFACYGFDISNSDRRIILDSNYLLKELTNAAFNDEFNKILQISNIEIFDSYKTLFEEYFDLKFKDLLILTKLNTLEEKKTYLGIKNKSNIYKYRDINIINDKQELTKLIYKLSKEIVKELIEYYDLINDTNIIDLYNKIIKEEYYSKTQLAITSKEIIEITNKEQLTSYYIDQISYSIISGKIKNSKEEIIKYILEIK